MTEKHRHRYHDKWGPTAACVKCGAKNPYLKQRPLSFTIAAAARSRARLATERQAP